MTEPAGTFLLEPGGLFGSYRVIDRIGKGGKGEVYLAETVRGGDKFAIKVMSPPGDGETADFNARFMRETGFAMGIDHSNVVKTFDAGLDPDTGLCYIVMEYLPGGSLRDIIKSTPGGMSFSGIASTARDIASALAYLESKSLVHRDIKPDNVLFDGDGRAKLADLGMSRLQRQGQDARVTDAGDVVGTPAYMAPEQMLDPSGVDARADIYSLGVMMYEMIAGKRPNEGESAINTFAKAIGGQAFQDVRLARPDTPPVLASLVSAMTQPSAGQRPASAAEVSALLRTMDGSAAKRTFMPERSLDYIAVPQIPWYRDTYLICAIVALAVSVAVFAAAIAGYF